MKKCLTIILIALQVSAFAQIPFGGLVGYYPLNGNANDSSGNAFNGVLNGQTIDRGICSPAYRFINNYIDCGDPTGNQFDIVNDASLCFWFKLKANAGGSPGFTLLGKDVSGGTIEKWFVSAFSDSIAFHINAPGLGGGFWRCSNPKHFMIDTFYHVVITKTGNNFQFYINAAPWGARSFPVNIPDVPANLHIGRNENIGTNTVIDEVLIYNRVLSQVEINSIYNNCNPTAVSAGFSTAGTSICAGTCIGFVNTSVGATGYQWSFPGAATASSTSITPTGICYNTPGLYDVQLIADNGTMSDTLLLTNYITVNAKPVRGTVTALTDSICSGGLGQLKVSGSAGVIQWQISGNGVNYADIPGAQDTTYVTSPISQTTYYRVKLQSAACGADSSSPGIITVLAKPSAGLISAANDTICEGSTGSLTLAGSSGNTIQWQSGTTGSYTDISGANGAAYNTSPLLQTTLFRVVVSNGVCADTSVAFALFVPPALTAIYTESFSGPTVTFNSSGSLGDITFYSWDFGDGSTSNDSMPVHTYAKTDTTYNVCLTIYDGSNCSFTFCKDVQVGSSGIAGISAYSDLLICPNPAQEVIYIEAGGQEIQSAELVDVLGRNVWSNPSSGRSKLQLNIASLPVGIYCMKVKTATYATTRKVIKQ